MRTFTLKRDAIHPVGDTYWYRWNKQVFCCDNVTNKILGIPDDCEQFKLSVSTRPFLGSVQVYVKKIEEGDIRLKYKDYFEVLVGSAETIAVNLLNNRKKIRVYIGASDIK